MPIKNGDKVTRKLVETPIYLIFWYDQVRIKLSTGEKIHPSHWNATAHKCKTTKDNPEGSNINLRLDYLRTGVLSAVRDYLNEHQKFDPGEVKPILQEDMNKMVAELLPGLKKVVRPPVVVKPSNFILAVQEFIETSNNKATTIRSYQQTLKTLQEYEKKIKHPLAFENINLTFYTSFVKFLRNDKKFAPNTVGNKIKHIKVFMSDFVDKGYTLNMDFMKRKFKKTAEKVKSIYLNEKEIMGLYNKDLSDNPKLDRIRDIFVIGCYTGLRFSDLSQLTPDNFTDNQARLRLTTQKTGEEVVIPLHPTIKAILKKYNNNLPRVPSNQKFNDYLKELGQLAELNEKVVIDKKDGSLARATTVCKWELITVHTARRSFATNSFIAGIPTVSIMKITGHTSERIFMDYIKISKEENANEISNHPFFNQSPLKAVK